MKTDSETKCILKYLKTPKNISEAVNQTARNINNGLGEVS